MEHFLGQQLPPEGRQKPVFASFRCLECKTEALQLSFIFIILTRQITALLKLFHKEKSSDEILEYSQDYQDLTDHNSFQIWSCQKIKKFHDVG